MNKDDIRRKILDKLEENHRTAVSATQRAIDAATDDETVPEHKYDTLALEASYLAHGQAMRVHECELEILKFKELVLRDYTACAIGVAAYVEVMDEEEITKAFFIGPSSGGLCIEHDKNTICVLTTSSPMGQALIGQQEGDEITLTIRDEKRVYEIMAVR